MSFISYMSYMSYMPYMSYMSFISFIFYMSSKSYLNPPAGPPDPDTVVLVVCQGGGRVVLECDWPVPGGAEVREEAGGEVWQERCGRRGVAGEVWHERCGRRGVAGEVWHPML